MREITIRKITGFDGMQGLRFVHDAPNENAKVAFFCELDTGEQCKIWFTRPAFDWLSSFLTEPKQEPPAVVADGGKRKH